MAAKSSKKIPEKVIDFKLSPAIKLKHSAECLCDPEFNPKAMAMVNITKKGFEISFCNSDSKAAAILLFESSAMIRFYCRTPIVRKWINVHQVCSITAKDDDILNVFHLDGSNQLTFSLGSDSEEEYYVQLLNMDAIQIIPDIKFYCDAVLTPETFMKMIEQLEKIGVVDFNIKQKCFQVVGKKGMTPRQRHRPSFIMPHQGALKKACFLTSCIQVCFSYETVATIMLRFFLPGLGDLLFTCKSDQDYEGEKEELICSSDAGGIEYEEIVLQPQELEHLGTTAGQKFGRNTALSYTICEVLPYKIDSEVITKFQHTTKDTSYCAEVTDSELRKRNRNMMKAIFKTCLNDAFLSMKHFTLMVILMDAKREIAIKICCANAEAARLARHGIDSITISKWLYNKVGRSILGTSWLYAKFLLKRGNCPVDVSDKFLMADPTGLLWNETDLLNEGMRGTEVFMSLVGYLGNAVDGLHSAKSVHDFLAVLDSKSINNFSILAAAGKIVVPGLGDFAEGLGADSKEMKQDLAL